MNKVKEPFLQDRVLDNGTVQISAKTAFSGESGRDLLKKAISDRDYKEFVENRIKELEDLAKSGVRKDYQQGVSYTLKMKPCTYPIGKFNYQYKEETQ